MKRFAWIMLMVVMLLVVSGCAAVMGDRSTSPGVTAPPAQTAVQR